MIQRLLQISLIVLVAFAITGCNARLTPIQVSEKFWTAVKEQDAGAARLFIAEGTATTDGELTGNVLPINNVALGRTVIDGDEAWVDTDVEIAADKPFNMSLKTVLLRREERWKVDYDATVASISSGSDVARVLGKLSEFSGQFSRELDRSLEDMQRALPEIRKEIEKLEENMRKQLPELRQKLEEFLRQLEESMGNGRKKEETAPGTREI